MLQAKEMLNMYGKFKNFFLTWAKTRLPLDRGTFGKGLPFLPEPSSPTLKVSDQSEDDTTQKQVATGNDGIDRAKKRKLNSTWDSLPEIVQEAFEACHSTPLGVWAHPPPHQTKRKEVRISKGQKPKRRGGLTPEQQDLKKILQTLGEGI